MKAELCTKCRKELFDGQKISLHLNFFSPEQDEAEVLQQNVQHISISGAQIKYSVKREQGKLVLAQGGGEYILKPIPVGTFKELNQAPANEHLTMQIAKQVLGIPTAACVLVYFKDGKPGYLTRRFDVKPDGSRIQQEDFAQLAQLNEANAGESYKYEYSYEEAAALIRKYVAAYPVQLELFFKLVIANYLLQNGDGHLKNFSVFRTQYEDYILTPAYDLMNTKIHIPTDVDLALKRGLFKDNFETDSFKANGYYGYDDFLEFGKRIGILEVRVEKILKTYLSTYQPVIELIERSFLRNDCKEKYQILFKDKYKAIGYSFLNKMK